MKITEHFNSDEFSQRSWRKGLSLWYPKEWFEDRLKPLCEALEVIRLEFNKPITILSGYRSPAFNTAIGGAKTSQHMQGRAADIQIKGISAQKVHDRILALVQTGNFYLGGLGAYDTFTHIDVRPGARLARWRGTRTATTA